MAKKIVVVVKGRLDLLPPVLTLIHGLHSLGRNVVCICSACDPQNRETMELEGTRVFEVCPELANPTSIAAKIRHYTKFRRAVWNVIDAEKGGCDLWVATLDTAMAIGPRLCAERYVLGILELYDTAPFYYRKAIAKYAPKARMVVVPEACRAAILRTWYHMEKTPSVLPNRPLTHPRKRCLPISDANARRAIESVAGKRTILYQGVFSGDRDLVNVARAVHEMGDEYRLLLMGRGEQRDADALKEACPTLIQVPWVLPPMHLEVTSHACLGIAGYRYDSLNSVFCAPNKIWEYAGFGIPMVCQDLPGLRFTVGVANAGVCVGFESPQLIAAAIRTVAEDYEGYRQRASTFFDSFETREILGKILDEGCLRESDE